MDVACMILDKQLLNFTYKNKGKAAGAGKKPRV
jgi:hypothetical protein